MPTFRPPLYHTSEVITDESAPYAKLTFTVSLDNDEGVDGVYQLWTDLANLNDDGTPVHGPGEWHEISFNAPTSLAPVENTSAGSSLQSCSIPSAPSSVLSAVVHIPSTPASYSYTLRQAKSSGEIVWLGSDGSNGSIHVKEGETSTEVVIESGVWDGTLKDMEKIQWGGVAITMDALDSAPSIVQLPSSESIKPSLVVAVGLQPIETLPFFQPSSEIDVSTSITRNIAMAVAGSSKKPLEVSSGSILPTGTQKATFGRSESGSLSSAILTALNEQSSPAFKIVDSSEDHVVLSPVRAEHSTNADLVVLSYSPSQSKTISAAIPSKVESTSPILCQIANTRRILKSNSSSSSIDINVYPGLGAEIIRFTEMSELRVSGGEDSIWICAPKAQSVQVGEEEIGTVASSADIYENEILIVGEDQDETEGDATLVPGTISEAGTSAREANESEYEAEDEDDAPVVKQKEELQSFWLLRMLDSLLVRIWSWIFSPAQLSPRVAQKQLPAAEAEDGGNETETAVESSGSGADERTPLLTTPGLSRSTSSTFNSPLASPASTLTVKAKQSLDSFAKNSKDHTKSVTIRSYTQFSFTAPPPFTFYLPAETTKSWQEKLRFSTQTQHGAEWTNAETKVKGEEGAIEVQVGASQAGGDQGSAWEVQVERL